MSGAHGVATGLGSAEAPEPPAGLRPTGAIPCAAAAYLLGKGSIYALRQSMQHRKARLLAALCKPSKPTQADYHAGAA